MEQRDDQQHNLMAAAVPPTPTAAITVIPDDVLANDVFRRVASPRRLAACRCVCRAWRALIDDRRLLRADLLPLSLAGLLLCLNVEGDNPELFARPGADVTGYRLPRTIWFDDHCSGLVLIHDDILNPATGRVVRLPKCPLSPLWEDSEYFLEYRYLAFDPAESPHYQVFCIPMVCVCHVNKEKPEYKAITQSEWPPSPFVLGVFSSATGRWEARSLVRRCGAAGTVNDIDMDLPNDHLHSACWRGALYIRCQNDFVLRIPVSSDHTTTYQVIKPPREVEECSRGDRYSHLGKSKKGVYLASFDREQYLCVWILHGDSSCGHMEWIPKHRSAYGLALPSSPRSPWSLHNAFRSEDGKGCAQEWDSDDDSESTLYTETGDGIQQQLVSLEILALHPYREIIFMLMESRKAAYAYHLKTSKLEDLGNVFPKDGTLSHAGHFTLINNSFPYTPCWMGTA